MKADEEIIGIYEVLDALREVIVSSDPTKRENLAKAVDGWAHDFPEDFHWATGVQAPMLLFNLLVEIDTSCRDDKGSRPRTVIRLVDRKPEGNA